LQVALAAAVLVAAVLADIVLLLGLKILAVVHPRKVK
jgi:hypothetical protein